MMNFKYDYFIFRKLLFCLVIFFHLIFSFSICDANPIQWLLMDSSNTNLPDNTINDITQDNDGFVWVATNNGFAKYTGNNNWTVLHNPNSTTNDVCISIKAQDSIIWVATVHGLVRYCNSNLTVYDPSNSTLDAYYIYSLAVENSTLWIGTGEFGVYKFDGSTFVNYTYFNTGNMPLGNVWSIAVDQSGQKWFSCIDTRVGFPHLGSIVKFDNISWTLFDSSNTILQNNPNAISVDALDNKWITSTYEYLVRYDNLSWMKYDSASTGGRNLYGYSRVAFDQNNNKWMTLSGSVALYDDFSWTLYDSTNVPYPNQINVASSIYVDVSNNKWIGTIGSGILIFNASGIALTEVNELTVKSTIDFYQINYIGYSIINLDIKQSQKVKLSILDQNGKVVLNVFDEFLPMGIYEFHVSNAQFASALYFILVSSIDGNIIKKYLVFN